MSNIFKAFVQNKKEHPAGPSSVQFPANKFNLKHECDGIRYRINSAEHGIQILVTA